jgi:hypothetical protein
MALQCSGQVLALAAIIALGAVYWLVRDHNRREQAQNIPELCPIRRCAMTTRKLEKKQWSAFFDHVSKMLEGKQAEIEVASLALGDQVQAEWLPLHGITYDPRDDLVEVALEGLDHMIAKPREIYVQDGNGGLASLEVIDSDGAKQIVKLRDQLTLPGAKA